MPSNNQIKDTLSNVTPLEKIELLRSHLMTINYAMSEIMIERHALKLVSKMTDSKHAAGVFQKAETDLMSAAIDLANQLESIHNISA